MEHLRQVAADTAMQNIGNAQARQKRNYDRRCNPEMFEVGSEVLMEVVKNKNRCGGKMAARYTGPYKVYEKVKKVVYRLEHDGVVLKKTVNVNRLKAYCNRDKVDGGKVEEPTKPKKRTADEQRSSEGVEEPSGSKKQKADEQPSSEGVEEGEGDCIITGEYTDNNYKTSTATPKFRPLHQRQLGDIKKCRYWLNDIDINAAQALIREQYPNVGGLHDTCLGDNLQFEVQQNEFVQV